MAVVGCYTLDLYCDTGGTAFGENCPHPPTIRQFAGQTESECLAQARKRGWTFKQNRTLAYCPSCSRGMKNEQSQS